MEPVLFVESDDCANVGWEKNAKPHASKNEDGRAIHPLSFSLYNLKEARAVKSFLERWTVRKLSNNAAATQKA